MASNNPSSVRDELDRLKHEFTRLSKEGAIPSETKLLMQSMFTSRNLFSPYSWKKRHSNLLRNVNKAGIDNLPFLGFISLFVKLIVKTVKQFFHYIEFHKLLSKQPNCFSIWNTVRGGKTQK